MILFHALFESAAVIRDVLNIFYEFTDLKANNSKSCLFTAAVNESLASNIRQILQFTQGDLTMRYLGVPLLTAKLKKGDCEDLVKKITARINSWNAKCLSFVGRIQLIQYVLNGIQCFWSAMFILPQSVLKEVKSLMRRFLWSGNFENYHGAKVSWNNICRPKKQGGLGFRNLPMLNKIQNLRHIWHILNPSSSSLWVQWIHAYMIKNQAFGLLNHLRLALGIGGNSLS